MSENGDDRLKPIPSFCIAKDPFRNGDREMSEKPRVQCTYCGAEEDQGHRANCLFNRSDAFFKRNSGEIRGAFEILEKRDKPQMGPPPWEKKAKPLTWRTGPVPDGVWVFYKWFLDGHGVDYEVGEGRDDGNIGGNFTMEWENTRWLPLSEILDLIGG